MCFRAFQYLKEITWKQVGTSFLGACIFVVLAEKLVESDQFHFIIFYLALIYLMFYVGFIYLYKRTKVGHASIAFYALLVVVVESTLNMAFTSITTTSRTSYVEQDANIETLIDGVMPSDDFFRVEKIDRKTKNDGAWEHFPSVSLFSSVANADLTKFFKYLGCESSTNAYSITGSTPLVDMLFSVRYALYEDVPEVPWKWEVASSGDMYLYENQYVLPLGFGVDTDFEEKWYYTLSNPAEVQNNLAEVYGVSPVLVEVEGENIGGDYRVEVQQDGEYYAYITNKKVDDVAALIGDNTKSFDNVKRGYLLELGECYERSTIMLDSPESKEDVTAHVYRVDEEALGELYSAMSREGWHLTEWRDTYLAGKITARKDRLLFTTIPYDTGWTVKVDGEEVETRKVVDTFLGFEIGAGEHEITMEYRPDGFLQGVWISVGSLILLLILAVAERMFQKDNNELDLEETDENSEKMSQGRGRKRGNYVQLRKIGRISSKDSTEGDRFEVWEEEGEQEKNPQSEEESVLEEDMLEEDTRKEGMREENDEQAEKEKDELVIEDIGTEEDEQEEKQMEEDAKGENKTETR